MPTTSNPLFFIVRRHENKNAPTVLAEALKSRIGFADPDNGALDAP